MVLRTRGLLVAGGGAVYLLRVGYNGGRGFVSGGKPVFTLVKPGWLAT